MNRLPFSLAACALLATTLLPAQTAGPSLTEFALERRIDLATTHTSTDLAIPAEMVPAIASGAFEVRERLFFNPAGATLTSTMFVVQNGAPIPTPINASLSGNMLGTQTLNVERLQVTLAPRNSISFTGTVSGSSAGNILGNVAGLPFSVTLSFTDASPTAGYDLVHVIAGRIVAYSREAFGTLVVPRPPVPPVNPTGPQIVIDAPPNTVSRQISLDASGTTDDSGTSLSFVWQNVNKSAVILNPNTAVATIQFTEGAGDYSFSVTVTNGRGQTATKQVTISYFGR